ncbi:TetR family transcriptional regulator [Streptomyces sp. NPDC088348]|uniref:TetR family transcriptional regulator n=1 Tax=Streptomyces sp. NPDC088348 TaxID=3365853 RepID=UPI003817589D
MATDTTRARLLDEAERLFLERGYELVSVRAVNAAAGMNPAAVHYHFGSKEDLVVALLQSRLGPLWADRLATLTRRRAAGWTPGAGELARINRRKDGYGGSLDHRAGVARGIARAVRDEVGDRIAITAKLNMEDGVRGGLGIDESIQVARRLQDDGSVDALQLTAASSLLNPMYLFRGDAPVKEFAAQFPQPQRLGIRLIGKQILRAYPYREAYLLESGSASVPPLTCR